MFRALFVNQTDLCNGQTIGIVVVVYLSVCLSEMYYG